MDPSTIIIGMLALAVIIFVRLDRRLEKRVKVLEDRHIQEVAVEQKVDIKSTVGAMVERADGSVEVIQ